MTALNKTSLDQMKKNLAKRSFNVQFDLDNTDYKPLENIGIGAYGVVCSAIHKKSQDKVAIKKIPLMSHKDVTKRTYREIKILKHFKHDNIIDIRELLKPKIDDFQEIYVVFDLMESDLHRIIYTDQELTEEHTRYFLYQILRGLKYIHSANVIHRDLKPSNLLVNEDCHVKIGDFGMARGISQARDEPCYYMTQYVATRWYRAPEILLGLVEYGSAVDMWSVGCIFAEMLGRKSLFPGKDYLNQVKLIIGLLGSPSTDVLQKCQAEVIARILKGLSHKQAVPLRNIFPKASKKALSLLGQMLVIDPVKRVSVVKALEHPFLSKYHDPDDEPICVPTFNFDFEKQNLSQSDLHDAIYKEIMELHQPKTPTLSFNAILRPAPKTDGVPPPQTIEEKNMEQLHDLLQELHHRQQPGKPEIDQAIKEDDVFKKPPAQPSSLVTVDTNALVPPHSGDVVMLSAKSTDGKHEMDLITPAPSVKPGVKDESRRPPAKQSTVQSSENKTTLSSDTKALAKQALLNANQRRNRTESAGDESSGKPRTTAAQRQKERQDKREKKKNKLLERQKKQREKPTTEEPLLSTADRALLERWSVMQPRIAPATSVAQPGITLNLSGGNVTLAPISQSHGTQPTQIQTVQVSGASAHQVPQIPGSQIPPLQVQNHQPAAQGVVASNTNVATDFTKTQVGGLNGSDTPQKSPPSATQGIHPAGSSVDNQNLGLREPSAVVQSSGHASVNFQEGQHFLQAADGNSSSGSCLFPNQSPEFSVPNVTDPSVPHSVLPSVSTSPTSQGSTFAQTSPPQNSSIPQPSVPQSTPPLDVSFVGIDLLNIVGQGSHLQSNFEFQPYPDQQLATTSASKRHSIGTSMPGTYPTEQPFSEQQSTPCRHTRLSEGDAVHHLTSSFLEQHSYDSQNIPFQTPSHAIYSKQVSAPFVPDSYGASVARERSDPGLKIFCSTSRNNTPDQIALLTKQLSKSQVEDVFPPALSLTPKGTGGGYGVGADLDALMLDAQDSSCSESPLSSSLIADWLAVRGNISQADIEALEQEMAQHSPMTL